LSALSILSVLLFCYQVFLPGDTIIQQGEIGIEMFFLVRGLISIEKMTFNEAEEEWVDTQIAKLKAGSYFGELALLRKGGRSKQRRAASCIALTDCDTRILTKDKFNNICEDFPELREYLQAEANRKYAMYSSPKESEETKETKNARETKNGAAQKKLSRVNSIVAALSHPNVQIINGQSIKKRRSSIRDPISAWSPSPTREQITTESPSNQLNQSLSMPSDATLFTLQTTLDAINLRMSRLEVNMGRLQSKKDQTTGPVKPPDTATAASGSNARRYITSPNTSKKGWSVVRNIVRPASVVTTNNSAITAAADSRSIRDDEDNKSNSSIGSNGSVGKRLPSRPNNGSRSSGSNSSRTTTNRSPTAGLSNSRWGNILPSTPSMQDETSEERRSREEERRAKSLSNRRW